MNKLSECKRNESIKLFCDYIKKNCDYDIEEYKIGNPNEENRYMVKFSLDKESDFFVYISFTEAEYELVELRRVMLLFVNEYMKEIILDKYRKS